MYRLTDEIKRLQEDNAELVVALREIATLYSPPNYCADWKMRELALKTLKIHDRKWYDENF